MGASIKAPLRDQAGGSEASPARSPAAHDRAPTPFVAAARSISHLPALRASAAADGGETQMRRDRGRRRLGRRRSARLRRSDVRIGISAADNSVRV